MVPVAYMREHRPSRGRRNLQLDARSYDQICLGRVKAPMLELDDPFLSQGAVGAG